MSEVKIESVPEKQKRLFRQYIQNKRVLIVDSQAYSRAALSQTLIDLGTSSTMIELSRSFDECKAAIERKFPDILIAEYDLDGGQCGLDLLQSQRKSNAESKRSLFILVTSNTSQAAVARAAEEDVDGYILKPYTMDGLRNSIMKYAVIKAYPSEYAKVIEEGKEQLEQKEIEKALSTFERAAGLEAKPALALFYHGQTEELKKTLSNAETDYGKGLSFNKIHYKCLVGLFDLFYSQNRNREAYEIVRKISHYFPANPDRLATVLRLAVINNAFEDIERYYQLFCKLEKRNPHLIRFVCAALIVCGKYYLLKKVPSRAVELFNKAKATGARHPRLLREIITSLLEHDMVVESEEFLKAYPPGNQSSDDYLALRFAVENFKHGIGPALTQGRELINRGLKDPLIFEILIKRSMHAGVKQAAEELHHKACKLFPDQTELFDNALKGTKKSI